MRRLSTLSYWDNIGKKKPAPSIWEKLLSQVEEKKGTVLKPVESVKPLPKFIPPEPILVRDFIHDSLYNPSYGYFSKKAHIFSLPEAIDYKSLDDSVHFQKHIAEFYRQLDEDSITEVDDIARQVL